MPGWHDINNLVKFEFIQSAEEGRDSVQLNALRREWDGAPSTPSQLEHLYDRILAVPIRTDFPYQEPDDLPAIRALRQSIPSATNLEKFSLEDQDTLKDRMRGAWLGRCVGCALGKPIEMFMEPRGNLSSRQRQKKYLTAISENEWPLRDYIPEHSPAEKETGSVLYPKSTREHIAFMETDDDIRYTVLGQIVLLNKGRKFNTRDVALAWMEHLGYAKVCTAETQAYRNLILRYEIHSTPSTEDLSAEEWQWVATHQNPYREWIGAQIRVDSYGYAVPGQPTLAAELAHRDARLSHTKNGLYGAMFCAAMIAAAYCRPDPRTLVEIGLAEIPATSRLHAGIRKVIALCDRLGPDRFEEVFDEIELRFGSYDPVHTINNAALCAAALLLSEGDFSRGVTLAVMGGWDTDCNGATVGSILGALHGADRLPTFWTDRLHDTLKTGIVEYHPIAISECARISAEIARNMDL